jgi:hypothetical protein
MRKEIKYIGFYDLPDAKGGRVSSLALINKMDYISDAINQAGFDVHIVSPSWSSGNGEKVTAQKGGTIQLHPHKKVTFCPTFATENKLTGYLKIIYSLIWLFFWLVKNVKRNELLLLYHVQWLSMPVRWAKKIKGFQLILEVEEIYGDVSAIHPYFNVLENKILASADKFIFSTELLVKKIKSTKPYIIIYGEYKIYPKLEVPPDDGKIHLLYAGIIDTHKAGAFNAVEAARYLSGKYVLHVIGFGEVELLKKKISNVNSLNGCHVVYEGVLSGDDYISYCQRCHIGLSTQNMDGEYLNSSFPSKVLSYMALGLVVVSCNIECVKISKIGEFIYYYNNNNPKEIAEAIVSIDFNNLLDSASEIKKLNDDFVIALSKLLTGV